MLLLGIPGKNSEKIFSYSSFYSLSIHLLAAAKRQQLSYLCAFSRDHFNMGSYGGKSEQLIISVGTVSDLYMQILTIILTFNINYETLRG